MCRELDERSTNPFRDAGGVQEHPAAIDQAVVLADIRGDGNDAACHRFQQRQREAFYEGGEYEDIESPQEICDPRSIFDVLDEADGRSVRVLSLQSRFRRALTDEDEACVLELGPQKAAAQGFEIFLRCEPPEIPDHESLSNSTSPVGVSRTESGMVDPVGDLVNSGFVAP